MWLLSISPRQDNPQPNTDVNFPAEAEIKTIPESEFNVGEITVQEVIAAAKSMSDTP